MHALNNALGFQQHDRTDMERACTVLLDGVRHERLTPELQSDHKRAGGWYSMEVIAQSLTTTSIFKQGRVNYVLQLRPLHVDPDVLRVSIGAVVNIRNVHWVALRFIEGQVWYINSESAAPRKMTWSAYVAFVGRHKGAFPIVRAPPNAEAARSQPLTRVPTATLSSGSSGQVPGAQSMYSGHGPLPDRCMEEEAQRQLNAWCVSLRADNVFLFQIPAERINVRLDELRERIWASRAS
jgi:hypothetical protein